MSGARRLGWDEPAPADLFDHLEAAEPTGVVEAEDEGGADAE